MEKVRDASEGYRQSGAECQIRDICSLAALCSRVGCREMVIPCRGTTFGCGEHLRYERAGEPLVYVVKSGVILSQVSSLDGEELPYALFGKGNVLGLMEVFVAHDSGYSLKTLSEVDVCIIRREALRNALDRDPETYRYVSVGINNVFAAAWMYTQVISRKRVCDRIRVLLKVLEDMVHGNEELQLSLTHEEIARIVCSDRATVTHTLHKLREEGHVGLGYRQLRIVDWDQTDQHGLDLQFCVPEAGASAVKVLPRRA